MITVENRRYNGMECPPVVQIKTPDQAFFSLAVFEMGYGGRIVEITDTKVVIVTQVLACTDTVTFTGSVSDMELLVKLASMFVLVQAEHGTKIIESVANSPVIREGIPLVVKNLGPMLVGRQILRLAVFLALGYTDPADFEICKNKMSIQDLIAGLQLAKETGCPLTEIL
jgi:hypothetical protein